MKVRYIRHETRGTYTGWFAIGMDHNTIAKAPHYAILVAKLSEKGYL